MIQELIRGDSGSAQAIIQRVCQQVGRGSAAAAACCLLNYGIQLPSGFLACTAAGTDSGRVWYKVSSAFGGGGGAAAASRLPGSATSHARPAFLPLVPCSTTSAAPM